VLLNRPYLGGHKQKHLNMLRVSVNSFACTTHKEIPFSRWKTVGLEKQPWKVSNIENILIAPPVKGVKYFSGKDLDEWIDDLKDTFKDFNVKIRYKDSMKASRGARYSSLWQDFDWADIVVSCASASTAEAFWYGKKVISLGPCPTLMCNTGSLENIIDPSEPTNREQWHEHISWLQFKNEEWRNGDAQDMTAWYQNINFNL